MFISFLLLPLTFLWETVPHTKTDVGAGRNGRIHVG